MGVCFIVDDIVISQGALTEVERGPLSGQVISAMKEGCRREFLSRTVRLVEATYLCDIQIPADFVGKVYTVLGRRRAKILNELVNECSIRDIQALLPVAESFGLSEEILTYTSGRASTQLMFSNWEVLEQDPFFVARTQEELEDIGENLGGVAPNLANLYMNAVRKRKGLKVEEKIVVHGDKQRTFKKNK